MFLVNYLPLQYLTLYLGSKTCYPPAWTVGGRRLVAVSPGQHDHPTIYMSLGGTDQAGAVSRAKQILQNSVHLLPS